MAKRGRKPYTAKQKARAYELKKAKMRVKYMEKQGFVFTEEFKKSLETKKTKTLKSLKGKALKGKADTWQGEMYSTPISQGTEYKAGKKHEKQVAERLKQAGQYIKTEKQHRKVIESQIIQIGKIDDTPFRRTNIEKTLDDQMNWEKGNGAHFVYDIYKSVGGTGTYDDFLDFMVKAVDEGLIDIKDINYDSTYKSNQTANDIDRSIQKMNKDSSSDELISERDSTAYDVYDDLNEYLDRMRTDDSPAGYILKAYDDWIHSRVDMKTLLELLMNYYR